MERKYTYVLRWGDTNFYKIVSSKKPHKRCKQINSANLTGNPFLQKRNPISLIYVSKDLEDTDCFGATGRETHLHKLLNEYRLEVDGYQTEWFCIKENTLDKYLSHDFVNVTSEYTNDE